MPTTCACKYFRLYLLVFTTTDSAAVEVLDRPQLLLGDVPPPVRDSHLGEASRALPDLGMISIFLRRGDFILMILVDFPIL